MKNRFILFALILTNLGSALAQSKKIEFTAPKKYPEGIAINTKTNTAYVSSVKTGVIGAVDSKGTYKEFYTEQGLKSSFGMKVDEKKNLLWVCVGDPNYSQYKSPDTFKKMARIIAIDLSTGQKVKDLDLSTLYNGNHFLNDLVFDNVGNLYITDSFSPVIYRVDDSGKASVWATSELFKSKYVGLNGIAFHSGGFLLVAHNTDGCILKVDIKDPSKIERIKIANFFPGADGLSMDTQNNLILVQNKGVNKVFKLLSSDNWKTAKVLSSTAGTENLQNPTTLAWNKTDLYVLNAKLNELSDSTIKPSDSFSFQQVRFETNP